MLEELSELIAQLNSHKVIIIMLTIPTILTILTILTLGIQHKAETRNRGSHQQDWGQEYRDRKPCLRQQEESETSGWGADGVWRAGGTARESGWLDMCNFG